jgi:hypothetical protein
MQIGPSYNRIIKLLRRITKRVCWRWHHYITPIRDFVRPPVVKMYVAGRWYFKSAGHPHQLPAALVVSLTSYPPRFDTLVHTLRSLLRQTVKADHTILWIAHSDLPLLPKNITDLQGAGLEIRATGDMKSYKKIIPALDAFPNAFICTADDDIYYWPTWLEELIEGVNLPDRIVTCHRAHEITFDSQGGFKPYNQWVHKTRARVKVKSLFPTSGGGILYPPGVLAHTTEDREAGLSLCPHGDDIWQYWMARRNGAIFKTTRRWHDFILWHGSQKSALWYNNQNGNDEQIRRMVDRYGYPN